MAKKTKFVEAVGASSGSLKQERKPLAKKIEEAMSNAIAVSYQTGVTDPKEIKARMMAAREKVLEGN